MVRPMRALRLICGTAVLGLAASCAPVQSKTHFQRWDEHAAKIAAEEGAAADAAPTATAKPAATPVAAPAASPGSAPVYGSSNDTPAITGTSTASRVIRPGAAPAASDDDAIY